jgi:hypothetical protein
MITFLRFSFILLVFFGSYFLPLFWAETEFFDCNKHVKSEMSIEDWEVLKACEESIKSKQSRELPQKKYLKELQDNRLSSWIQWAYYTLEWCSPRYRQLSWSSQCKRWYFQRSDKTIKVFWDGKDISLNQDNRLFQIFKQAETQMRSDIKALQKNPSHPFIQSIFKDIIGIDISAEGSFRMIVYLMDYANNIGRYELFYKIDRTAPQIQLLSVSENSDSLYTERIDWLGGVGTRNDSFQSEFQSMLALGGKSTTARTRDLGTKRNTLYYSSSRSPFSVRWKVDDTWEGVLQASFASVFPLQPVRIVWSLLAWVGNQVDLVSGVPKTSILQKQTKNISPGAAQAELTWSGSSSHFTDNQPIQPSVQYYRFRIHDNTVWDDGAVGNYIEHPFYMVLDTTAPNGGSSTGIIFFSWGISVCDQLLSTTTCQFSKFFTAKTAQELEIRVADIAGGGGRVPYNHFNAGLPSYGNIVHRIEKSDEPWRLVEYNLSINDSHHSLTKISHDFSKISNDMFSLGWYRYYTGTFVTRFPDSSNQTPWVICDRVNNCTIIGNFAYRVMADTVDSSKSLLFITGSSEKMIANGKDAYILQYALRDTYDNPIVPVNAQELMQNGEIEWFVRDIQTGLNIRNTLRADMRSINLESSNTPNVLTFIDKEVDNTRDPIENTIVGDNNGNARYITHESRIQPNRNGVFTYELSSRVPTHDGYPWLHPDQTFSLQGSGIVVSSSSPLESASWALALYDPKSYTWNYSLSGVTWESIISFSGLVENPGDKFNISPAQILSYGTMRWYSGALSGLEGKRLSFPFASPIIGFWNNLDGLTDGAWKTYSYVTIFTDPTFNRDYDGYAWYEKYPACEIIAPHTICRDQHLWSSQNIVKYQFSTAGIHSATWVIGYASGISLDPAFFQHSTTSDGGPLFLSPVSIAWWEKNDARLTFFSLPGKVYDSSKLRVGIVSGLSYVTPTGLLVQLPWPSRNIFASGGNSIPNTVWSFQYFQKEYSIGPASESTRFDTLVSDIGIIGYTNTYNAITSDTSSDATTLLHTDLSATLKNSFRKKAYESIRGLSEKHWCKTIIPGSPLTLNIENFSSLSCIISVQNEKTIFVNGDVIIECNRWTNNTCNLHGQKLNILVRDGKTFIRSNISTLSPEGKDAWGVFIGSFLEDVANTSIPDSSSVMVMDGWIGIDTSVTNIDAFLFTERSIVTTQWESRTQAIMSDEELKNQLYVYGWIFSQNTVGWSRTIPPTCPFTIDPSSCTQEIAQIFDLTFLRRYHLVNKALVTGNLSENGNFVTFANGLRAGGWVDRCAWGSSGSLRCVQSDMYQGVPIILEKNEFWTRDPSVFMGK